MSGDRGTCKFPDQVKVGPAAAGAFTNIDEIEASGALANSLGFIGQTSLLSR